MQSPLHAIAPEEILNPSFSPIRCYGSQWWTWQISWDPSICRIGGADACEWSRQHQSSAAPIVEGEQHTQVANILGFDNLNVFFHILVRIWVVLTVCFKTPKYSYILGILIIAISICKSTHFIRIGKNYLAVSVELCILDNSALWQEHLAIRLQQPHTYQFLASVGSCSCKMKE